MSSHTPMKYAKARQGRSRTIIRQLLLIAVIAIAITIVLRITVFDSSLAVPPGVTPIRIDDKALEPSVVRLDAGQSVQFMASDGNWHQVAAGEGGPNHIHDPSKVSGYFHAGEGYRVTFDKPGTYYYHDHNFPEHRVTIIAK